MQVHGHHPVDAHGGDHVGHHLGGDRHPRGTHPAVLAGVAEVGHHGGDTAGGGAPQGIGHHQDFHQVIIGGLASGLDDEYVLAANIFLDVHGHFAIAEYANVGVAKRDVELLDHGLGQFGIGVAGKNHEFGHWRPLAVRWWINKKMAGVPGLEPGNDGIKNPLPYQLGYTPTLTGQVALSLKRRTWILLGSKRRQCLVER